MIVSGFGECYSESRMGIADDLLSIQHTDDLKIPGYE